MVPKVVCFDIFSFKKKYERMGTSIYTVGSISAISRKGSEFNARILSISETNIPVRPSTICLFSVINTSLKPALPVPILSKICEHAAKNVAIYAKM